MPRRSISAGNGAFYVAIQKKEAKKTPPVVIHNIGYQCFCQILRIRVYKHGDRRY